MAAASPPDEGMLVLVPVGGGLLDRLFDLGPRLEAAALQGEGLEDLPPGLDQVEVGGIGRLEDELPAWVEQAEQQRVGTAVGAEVVDHGVDPLDRRVDP